MANLQRVKNEVVMHRDGIVVLKASTTDDTFIIDEVDFQRVAQHTWNISTAGYPRATIDRQVILLHKFLKGNDGDNLIDHINHDKLDNRRGNLRFCTAQENVYNRKLGKNNKTGYIGVLYYEKTSKYKVSIQENGRKQHIGYYDNVITAAVAYNRRAVSRGNYAVLNEITEMDYLAIMFE